MTLFDKSTEVFYKVLLDEADDARWTSREFDEVAYDCFIGKAALGTENRNVFREDENVFSEIVT